MPRAVAYMFDQLQIRSASHQYTFRCGWQCFRPTAFQVPSNLMHDIFHDCAEQYSAAISQSALMPDHWHVAGHPTVRFIMRAFLTCWQTRGSHWH